MTRILPWRLAFWACLLAAAAALAHPMEREGAVMNVDCEWSLMPGSAVSSSVSRRGRSPPRRSRSTAPRHRSSEERMRWPIPKA